jgi:DNA-binding Lrp family transcriptional regulator
MPVSAMQDSAGARRGTVVTDPDDLRVVRALQLAPRASFARISAVLGIPERVVARRYRALRRDGLLRIFCVINPATTGQHKWLVRVHCRPDSAEALATAIARRDDVRWMSLSAAGSEIIFGMRSLSAEQRETLLTRKLPRTAHVLRIDAAVLLHGFLGDSPADWGGLAGVLTAGETDELAAARGTAAGPAEPMRLEPADHEIIGVLTRDGRASYAELAAAAGMSEGRVTRRLAALLRTQTIFMDMDLSLPAFGYPVGAQVCLRVTPARLHETGELLATIPEVSFVAAMTGPHNLMATVVCRDLAELYAFTSRRIGALDGVQTCEVSPVLRIVKQAGGLTDENGRLLDPSHAPPAERGVDGRRAAS